MSIPFSIRIPFIEQIGCELQRYDSGHAEITLTVDEAHTNSFGVAHGGLIMTMLDVSMAHAARSLRRNERGEEPGLVTIEMSTRFMRPGLGRIRALGEVMHATASLAFCEGRVLDEAGKVCAHATATFKFLRALPVTGKQVHASIHSAQTALRGAGSD